MRQNCVLAGQKAINAFMANTEWVPPSPAALKKETTELQRQNEDYYRLQIETATDSLTSILMKLAGLEVETAAFDNTQTKLTRAQERLNQIRTIKSVVSDELMTAELLWLFMQFDLEKLRMRSQLNLQEQYQSQSVAALMRMDLMRQSLKMPVEGILESYMLPISKLLAERLGEPVGGPQETFRLYEKLLQSICDDMRKLTGNKDKRSYSLMLDDLWVDQPNIHLLKQHIMIHKIFQQWQRELVQTIREKWTSF